MSRKRNESTFSLKKLFFKEYLISFRMICRLIDLHLWFFSYWSLKFVELLESQKWWFSIFLVLKGLNKIKKKIKNHSKPSKLVSQSLFKQIQQKPDIFSVFHSKLTFSLPEPRWVGANTGLPSKNNISKMVRVNIAFTAAIFKEYSISFWMICSLRVLH